MASSVTSNDYVHNVLEVMNSGQRPSSTLTQKAIKHYRALTERMKTMDSVLRRGNKDNYDYITDVFEKLNSGKHPPKCLVQKANKYYKSIKTKLIKHENVMAEKRIAEIGLSTEKKQETDDSFKEESFYTSKDENENILSISSFSFASKQVDSQTQEDQNKREIFKVMEANAKHISENNRLQEALDTAKSVIEKMSQQIHEQTRNDEIFEQNKHLQKELDAMREENMGLRIKNQSLDKELQSAQDEKDQNKKHASDIQKDLQHVTDENRRIMSENWSLKKEVGASKDKIRSQHDQISKLTQKAARRNEEDSVRWELQTLKESFTILGEEKQALKRELQSARNEIEKNSKKFHNENSDKDRKINVIENEIDTLREANVRLESENKTLKRKLKSAEKSIKEQLKPTEDDISENVDKSRQDESAQNVIQRLTEENERLGSEITKIMKKLKDAEHEKKKKPADTEMKPKQGISQADTELEKQIQMNKKLSDEKRKLEYEINDLKNRLSALASHKMTSDNPNIADLSDIYRPTNIADQIRQVYDDEWTEAYEELEKINPGDETGIIDTLASILKRIETFCIEVSSQQMDTLTSTLTNEITYPKYQHESGSVVAGRHRAEMSETQTGIAVKLLKDMRKSLGILSTGPLTQIFHQIYMSEHKHNGEVVSPKLNAFIAQAVKLIWMMKMQSPPMMLIWAEAQAPVDKNKFTFYTKRGDITKQCVWPAVLLHDNGPLTSRGIVQAV